MKFPIYWNKCRDCGAAFETLSDPGDGSVRVLNSRRQNLSAVVDCDQDPAFAEVGELVQKVLAGQHLTLLEQAEVFNFVFGELCDLAADGSHYNMTGKLACPKCGSSRLGFGPTSPLKCYSGDVPAVPHTAWDALTHDEKIAGVSEIIRNLAAEGKIGTENRWRFGGAEGKSVT